MLGVAIVGGGLCGLALARRLHLQGRDVALFEARERLGGRILSVPCARSGMRVDLGPGWFWPQTQPRITGLIEDLGLSHFAQHDEGEVLVLRDPDKKPERLESERVHNGARRLEGGMAGLVEALARDLPGEKIHLGHVLAGVADRGEHVELRFRSGEHLVDIAARQIVLALPPRLLAEHVAFEPALGDEVREAMREAATWMAGEAKIVIGYDRALWREAGQSGNAFVTHEQAVIGEIFDACDATGEKAALGGFLALAPALRDSFAAGLPMLMGNQMGQVFRPELEHGEQHYQDWARETFTCSALDLSVPRTEEYPHTSNPLLRRALWAGKLHLGGSETAADGAGYLEGALDAAARIEHALAGGGRALISDEATASLNAVSLAEFKAWVAAQGERAFDSYRHRLNRALAAQEREQLTQRAVLDAAEEVLGEALNVLAGLMFDMADIAVERGRSALTPDVQAPFRDFLKSLMDDVVAFNRTSCALSNFPDEHRLSNDYMQTILRDIAAAWRGFSVAANSLLLSKAEAMRGRQESHMSVSQSP